MPSSFAQTFSIEATRPRPAEIEQIARDILPHGTPVYVTAVPAAKIGRNRGGGDCTCAKRASSRSLILRRAGLPVLARCRNCSLAFTVKPTYAGCY